MKFKNCLEQLKRSMQDADYYLCDLKQRLPNRKSSHHNPKSQRRK